jgi:tetratricopeptide (TPR) repeat protein
MSEPEPRTPMDGRSESATAAMNVDARRACDACVRFEADLSALADGERTRHDPDLLARHVDECAPCRSYVSALAGMSRMHLFSAAGATNGHGLPDGTEMWSDLTRRLLDDNCTRLAAVLYELGKSLVAAGLRTRSDLRGVQVYARKPGSIRGLSRKGKALLHERRGLDDAASEDRRATVSRRGLFPQEEPGEPSAAFEAGRACLEQCLKLEPDRHEARIYLAKYWSVAGRHDRARQLLRAVLQARNGASDERMKFFALQQLSRLYSMTEQFERAVELEREVLGQAEKQQNELFQAAALTNLSIYCVKLGRLDDAESAIERLATRFEHHLAAVTVPAYRRAREFKRALLRHRSFLARLRGRYPRLFAS